MKVVAEPQQLPLGMPKTDIGLFLRFKNNKEKRSSETLNQLKKVNFPQLLHPVWYGVQCSASHLAGRVLASGTSSTTHRNIPLNRKFSALFCFLCADILKSSPVCL